MGKIISKSKIKIISKSRVTDSVKNKLDEADFREFDEVAQEDVLEWVQKNIKPVLELILGDEVLVKAGEDGAITINGSSEEEVQDACEEISRANPVVKKFFQKFLKDDEFGEEKDVLKIKEDMTPEQTNEWLRNFAAPAIKAFMDEHGVPADVYTDEEGIVKVVALKDPYSVVTEVVDSFLKEKKFDEFTLIRVKDDEEESEIDVEEFIEKVLIPSIEAHINSQELEADVQIDQNGDEIIIRTDLEVEEPKEKPEGESEEEIKEKVIELLSISSKTNSCCGFIVCYVLSCSCCNE
jgi:hypothetical protein